MNLVILTPGQKVYEGQVKSVNTPGTAGKIEILENHYLKILFLAVFFTMII